MGEDDDRRSTAAQRARDDLAQARREALVAAGERRREAVEVARATRREAIAAARRRPSERRQTPGRTSRTSLTLETILAEATRILDTDGIDGLTLRRLAGDLGAGVASVYWYVDDKDELLRLAFESTVGPPVRVLLTRPVEPEHWREGLRASGMAIYEVIEAHPWVAEVLNSQPRNSLVMSLWDRIGQLLTDLGFEPDTAFYAGSALMGLVGAAGMSAVREAHSDEDRDTRLGRAAGEFAALDPAEFPFISRTISTYRRHSERDQFLGGLDLVLDGIASRLPPVQGS